MDETTNPSASPDGGYWTIVPPKPPVNTADDIAKSAAAKGTLGATSDVLGAPGELTGGIQSGARWLGEKVFIDLPNALGANLNKAQIQADVDLGLDAAKKATLSPSDQAAVERGDAVFSPYIGAIPTPQSFEPGIKSMLPYTAHEPQTPEGDIFGSMARMGAGAAVTAPLFGFGAAPNVLRTAESGFARAGLNTLSQMSREGAIGSISGLGSEAAGQWAQENAPELEGWARLFGAVTGGKAADATGSFLKPWVMPKTFADQTAIKLLAQDFRNGTARMTLDEVNQAIDAGLQPTVFDMAGKETRAWLSKKYNISPEVEKNLDDLNDVLAGRGEQTRGAMREFLEGKYGKDLSTYRKEDLINLAKETENTNMFTAARMSPDAASIKSPELTALVKGSGPLKEAVDAVAARVKGKVFPAEWGVDVKSQNLSYWQQVKQELDDVIRRSKPNSVTGTGDTALFKSATSAKEKLLAILDDRVPEYQMARDTHSEKLGYASAPEAGESFASLRTSADFKEHMDVFNSYDETQKELFRRGLVRSLYDSLGNREGSLSSFVSAIKSPNSQKYFKEVLGPNYDAIVGRAVSQQTMDRIKAIQAVEPNLINTARDVVELAASPGAAAGVGAVIQYMLEGANAPAIAAYAAGVGLLAKNIALNAAERRIAPRVSELMKSNDPKDLVALGKLIQDNPSALSFVEKVNTVATRAPLQYVQTQQQVTEPPAQDDSYWQFEPAPEPLAIPVPQNRGGRVERKSGGRVQGNAISTEIRRTRALLAQKTASMLSVPDDAIIGALNIAKRK